MLILRTLGHKLKQYARQYPVVTLTGPRQSGKTTLCRYLFPQKPFFSLEDPDVRASIQGDPRKFLHHCRSEGAILDEVQRFPELFSYIQTEVDERKKTGQFILTGSQNFQLLHSVTQSLAGRTALATLLPFSYQEIAKKIQKKNLHQILYQGFFPRIFQQKLNPSEMLSFYVSTYIERDIRSLVNVQDLSRFETFVRMCASCTGQVLNLSRIGNDCGISHNTAKSWLSVLAASYLIHLVPPHHRNFRKRLVKAPKLYFTDPGLACYLLNIKDASHVESHPLRGAIFETFVVSEILKMYLNRGEKGNLYYFRDNVGNEVDLILEDGLKIVPVEIKLGQTIHEDFFKGIRYYKKLHPQCASPTVIYGGNRTVAYASEARVVAWSDIAEVFSEHPKEI